MRTAPMMFHHCQPWFSRSGQGYFVLVNHQVVLELKMLWKKFVVSDGESSDKHLYVSGTACLPLKFGDMERANYQRK